jgi:hypothetical protein
MHPYPLGHRWWCGICRNNQRQLDGVNALNGIDESMQILTDANGRFVPKKAVNGYV